MSSLFFSRIGCFLPKVRSGEDTDWLIRCSQFFDRQPVESIPLIYQNLPSNYLELYTKWFRNYSSCASICFHLQYQRLVYVFSISSICLFVAYNWNSVVASWNFANPFYVHNITKMVVLALLFLYCLIRVLFMPLARGVPLRFLLPLRFLRLSIICFVIDFAKVFAFLITRAPSFSFSFHRFKNIFISQIFPTR